MEENKICNWLSINLPENCPNICISFKKEIAEMQIKEFGANPLYGFDRQKEDWLPAEVFITYGGLLAPERGKEATKKGISETNERITIFCP